MQIKTKIRGQGQGQDWLARASSPKPTKLELSHTHNRVPPANVLITWNFDDLNDSHADDMVQAYRCGPNQSSERGTDQEAGSRDVKETFVAFFSESGWILLLLLHIHAGAASQRFP